MERTHWALSVIWMENSGQASLGTHLTARHRQTGGATFSCSRDLWDTEAHVGLSPPPPDLGIMGRAGSIQRWQQQMSQAAEDVLCIAIDSWGLVLGLPGRTEYKNPKPVL